MSIIDFPNLNVSESLPLLEQGCYLVQLKKAERKQAKKTGTEQMMITSEVVEGENVGATVVDYIALTDAAHWRVGKFLLAVGYDLKSLGKLDTNSEGFMRIITNALGRKVYLEITQDTYEGKTNNKVAGYLSYQDQEPIEYEDNVPAFIKAKAKKAGLI